MLKATFMALLVVTIFSLSSAHEDQQRHLQGGSKNEVDLDCKPCIYRPNYKLRGIFHGTKYSPFWQQISLAANQTATDLNVDLEITLYDTFDPDQMASDILSILDLKSNDVSKPDALIVTIPSQIVEDAVRQVTDSGIPVFGLNSGYRERRSAGVLAWVAQDEYIAGSVAGKEFLSKLLENTNEVGVGQAQSNNDSTLQEGGEEEEDVLVKGALFINTEKGNTGLESRYEGFADHLLEETGTVVEEVLVTNGVVDSTVFLQTNDDNTTYCPPWNVVLLGSSSGTINSDILSTIMAYDIFHNEEECGEVLFGTFDISQPVLDDMRENDNVIFSISQQNYIQGSLPVLFATLYITTGKLPATPLVGDYGVYLSGPSVITRDNIPSTEEQNCADQVFPICNSGKIGNDETINGCQCTDRSKIKIAGVLHGVTIDSFWDIVFEAAIMASLDMGIVLDLDRFEPEDTDELLHKAMANKIEQVCDAGVDGLFVTIPSDLVVESIQGCLDKGVNVLSINAGAEIAEEMGLIHHIGQLEFNAGFAAGKRIIDSGATKIWCTNHERGTQSLHQRCDGVAVAIAEESISNRNIEYGGEIDVPRSSDDIEGFKSSVEAQVYSIISEDDSDWEDVGLVLGGPIQIKPAIELRKDHKKVRVGTFDTNDDLFDSLKSKQFLFGINQQPFLQGYMPIPLLTYLSYTEQRLANDVIESGPSFVLSPPSQDQQTCELNFYKVCDRDAPPPNDSGGSSSLDTMSSLSRMTPRVLIVLSLMTIQFFL